MNLKLLRKEDRMKRTDLLLESLLEEAKRTNRHLSAIKTELHKWSEPRQTIVTKDNYYEMMLELPDHLRQSYHAIEDLKEATATQVASITKRARAVESSYLNQLVMFGFLKKRKEGRKTIFSI